MDNAAKALVIAGAILISIVLISLGILIVNRAQTSIDEGVAKMSSQEKQIFNAKFEMYEGRQHGTQVRALIGEIITNNNENFEIDGKVIAVEFDNISGANLKATSPIELQEQTEDAVEEMSRQLVNLRTNINTGGRYDITLNYPASGLINRILIEKV